MAAYSSPTGQPGQDEKARQIKSLFAEIQALLQDGQIARAEEVRDKLISVDAMALSEIIKSADLIEEAKSANIDKNHLAIWEKLYETLSEEEKNCLYYSLKKVVLPAGKIILKEGAYNTRLFFIDEGQVTIFHKKDNKQKALAQIGRGDVLGEYTFATISLCSASAVSHSEVQMMCLESAATEEWEQKQPGLYEKVIDFCLRYGRVDEIIKGKKLEKKTHTRYGLEGQVVATLLTQEGKKTETHFRGSLTDLSVAGTCFAVKISKKATARALLARYLLLTFIFQRGDEKISFAAVGKVVGLSFHLYSDYSVHIQFTKLLEEQQILKVVPQGD